MFPSYRNQSVDLQSKSEVEPQRWSTPDRHRVCNFSGPALGSRDKTDRAFRDIEGRWSPKFRCYYIWIFIGKKLKIWFSKCRKNFY